MNGERSDITDKGEETPQSQMVEEVVALFMYTYGKKYINACSKESDSEDANLC